MIKRSDHQVFHLCIWRSCRVYGLGEFVGWCVLFLREQVRDLRVQEFLRELIVCVAALGDLAGSIIVEILHSVEGGDVEQVCSNLEIICSCLRLLISLSLVFIYLACLYCLSLYMLDISCA